MTTLFVVLAITIVYVFVGMVVFFVAEARMEVEPAFLLAFFWPIAPPIVLVWIGLVMGASLMADWIDEKIRR